MLFNKIMVDPVAGFDNALNFNGVDSYISIPNESDYDVTSSITVESWIKVNSFDTDSQAIVSKGDSSWQLTRFDSSNFIELSLNGVGSVVSTTDVNDGEWHHVAGVYDGSNISIYVNGILEQQTPATGDIATNDSLVYIGENPESLGKVFNGTIDEARIWGTARTPEEIEESRLRGLTGSESGLLGYWNLDAVSGTTTPDFSTFENDGTLVNLDAADLVAGAPPNFSTNQNTAFEGQLFGYDLEGNEIFYRIDSFPSKGSLNFDSGVTGVFTYTPLTDATGSDSFGYQVVNLADLILVDATVDITINPVNQVSGDGLILGTQAIDEITGGTGNDSIYGFRGEDTLDGGIGNDRLEPGFGIDVAIGGSGDDEYHMLDTDVIIENEGEGTDTVFTLINWTLGENLENLTLRGLAHQGIGNELNNVITGNVLIDSDTLDSNTLSGGDGDDTLSGKNSTNDNLLGGAGNDRLIGFAGADSFTGGADDDLLFLGGDSDIDEIFYNSGDGEDTVNEFVRGVGGDQLTFSNFSEINVVTVGTDTQFLDAATDDLLVTLRRVTGFTSADENVNLFGADFNFS